MVEYRRFQNSGATWFITVNLAERYGNRLLVEQINALRNSFAEVKENHRFTINPVVIFPDHLDCIWSLPLGDSNFSERWGLIKANFSRQIHKDERISKSREQRGERGICQRRFWEHLIRDEEDYRKHVEYIHWNPVKYGWVQQVRDWSYSSFHRYVAAGKYGEDWGGNANLSGIDAGE
jgi:putative transposase